MTQDERMEFLKKDPSEMTVREVRAFEKGSPEDQKFYWEQLKPKINQAYRKKLLSGGFDSLLQEPWAFVEDEQGAILGIPVSVLKGLNK